MDEARTVVRRLQRIEVLEREGATPAHVLAELHELLVEAEAWVRSERAGTDDAEAALDRCREALAAAPVRAAS